VRRRYDAEAHRYDREIAYFEKLLFAGAREWVCSRARGDVLELAVGTGRTWPTTRRRARRHGAGAA
jgi:hypothetical protein